MSILHSTHRLMSARMSQTARIDGRIWIVAALLAYFVALWLASFVTPYTWAWQRAGVPTMRPIFADMRAILAGFECTRQGYDVLYSMPCDPYGRGSLAYPRLWMVLRWTGLDLRDSIAVGVLCALSWYAVVLALVGKLNKYESVVYILILCSPAAMLLVERSNVDILMFDLLFLVLIVIASKRPAVRLVGYALILVPSFLKLLPIFSIGVVFKEKERWKALASGALVSLLFLAYCVHIRDELAVFRSFYIHQEWYSSGASILPRALYERAIALSTGAGAVQPWKNVAVLVMGSAFTVIAARLAFEQLRSLGSWLGSREAPRSEATLDNASAWRLDAFRIGSCVFLGTFISTVTFDYKLTFLLFTVPQLLSWIKHDRKLGPSASVAVVGLVAMFYAGPFLYQWVVDEMINWSVAGYLVYALLMTLPDWAKTSARRALRVARP